ncbi:MAG TPA: outer membrane protein assembly factor BamD [Desulfuromonadaceae bacterium]|jgi:uncharacterized repeat protein (TIGR01451 family)
MSRPAVTSSTLAFLIGVVVLLVGITPCLCAELDDSALFVEAFNSFQKKDYLLTIEKIDLLSEVFPDSPLRDIALLLLARAGYKSGDNELAAKSANQFNIEFPENPLKAGMEDELQALAMRRKGGESLTVDKNLREAAKKVRTNQIALDRAAALKAENERLAREKAEKEAAEQKKRELIAAEKMAKEAIKVQIEPVADIQRVAAGKEGQLFFEITNKGVKLEEFLIAVPVSKEYAALLTSVERPEEKIERLALAPDQKRKISLKFRIPTDRVDGSKAIFGIQATSASYNDVSFSKEAIVMVSAPLLRVVAKPNKTKVSRGETVNFRIAVLNVGSIEAGDLTMRAILPDQLDFSDANGAEYRQAAGIVTFRVSDLESGKFTNISVNATVRENVANGQELRLQLELINGQLQRKDIFSSAPVSVQGK